MSLHFVMLLKKNILKNFLINWLHITLTTLLRKKNKDSLLSLNSELKLAQNTNPILGFPSLNLVSSSHFFLTYFRHWAWPLFLLVSHNASFASISTVVINEAKISTYVMFEIMHAVVVPAAKTSLVWVEFYHYSTNFSYDQQPLHEIFLRIKGASFLLCKSHTCDFEMNQAMTGMLCGMLDQIQLRGDGTPEQAIATRIIPSTSASSIAKMNVTSHHSKKIETTLQNKRTWVVPVENHWCQTY